MSSLRSVTIKFQLPWYIKGQTINYDCSVILKDVKQRSLGPKIAIKTTLSKQ